MKNLLPESKSEPLTDLASFVLMLYGDPKVGKSTFASQMPDPIFLATEAGLNALSVYQARVQNWEDFLQVCGELEKTKKFGTVVIDTLDNAYQQCLEYVCKANAMSHPADLEWGKGWSLVNKEFQRVIVKLSMMPRGLLLISHAQHLTIKTRTQEITKAVPTLPKSGRRFVVGLADIIMYAEVVDTEDGMKRIIRTDPSEYWEGGDRTGRLPAVIPLSYGAVEKAFKEGK
jgi:hypothetical protein